jgi:hypothetical protein
MRFRSVAAVAFACSLGSLAGAAEAPKQTVTLGQEYGASGFHQFFFGHDYRRLWTMPIAVEVLDLKTEDGGLTPVRRVGGQQTLGLAFKGASGRDWTFRGSDKDPSALLPPDLQGSIAQRIVQDQIAAGHPAGAVVAARLAEAAGVLHVPVRLVVMPDDPALGEFRAAFAGKPGTFEQFPNEADANRPGFAGALEIVGQEKFHERLKESAAVRADARAFLNARLFDGFIGDWDRHRKQWRWAKLPDRPAWQPIPEDRDQAFSRFEGLVLALGRKAQPRFVEFGPRYPRVMGLTYNGWEQDRQILGELDAAAWDEVAKALQARLTDAAIEDAVHLMPVEYQQVEGARLTRDLKSRRDLLVDYAHRYYRHLAGHVDVYGTEAADEVEIEHRDDGSVDVKVASGGTPYFTRRLLPAETSEVRLFLQGGDDRVVTRGHGGRILVRVVGGNGTDTLEDGAGHTRFSDASNSSRIKEGPGTHVDSRDYVPPPPNPKAPWIPPRDWDTDTFVSPWLGYGPDEGVFTGMALQLQSYGFRKDPYASRQTIRGGYAFGAKTFKFDYAGDFRAENSGRRTNVDAYASGIETLRFYGFGNETSQLGADRFHRVNQKQFGLVPSLSWPLGAARFAVGPVLKYSQTDLDDDRFIGTFPVPIYGTEDFGQVGARAGLTIDGRNRVKAPSHGALLDVAGTFYPKVWSVDENFGEVHGTAAAYLGAGGYFQPVLALRAGGKRVFGTYPFHEAAYLGGSLATGEGTTVRGFRQNRFAGDSSVFGNAELRIFLTKFFLLLPGELGAFGLADVGRVYLDGETSDEWHKAFGGGIWFAFLERKFLVSVAIAQSDERTGVYVRSGFGF